MLRSVATCCARLQRGALRRCPSRPPASSHAHATHRTDLGTAPRAGRHTASLSCHVATQRRLSQRSAVCRNAAPFVATQRRLSQRSVVFATQRRFLQRSRTYCTDVHAAQVAIPHVLDSINALCGTQFEAGEVWITADPWIERRGASVMYNARHTTLHAPHTCTESRQCANGPHSPASRRSASAGLCARAKSYLAGVRCHICTGITRPSACPADSACARWAFAAPFQRSTTLLQRAGGPASKRGVFGSGAVFCRPVFGGCGRVRLARAAAPRVVGGVGARVCCGLCCCCGDGGGTGEP
jgi:hypothetical protein